MHSDYKSKENLCKQCDKLFPSKNNLKLHTKSVHNKEKGFECEQCEKKFFAKQQLMNHVKLVHVVKDQNSCTRSPCIL